MNREQIIRMAEEAGFKGWSNSGHQALEHFAALVAAAVRKDADYRLGLLIQEERERIIQKNKPEIERINAHIKSLEDAVLAEREACAQIAFNAKTYIQAAAAIRARGEIK